MSESSVKQRDKRRLRRIVICVAAAFALLGVLAVCGRLISERLSKKEPSVSELNEAKFFEPDYSKDLSSDTAYLALDSKVYYTRYGQVTVLESGETEENLPQCTFFRRYFDCLQNGDSSAYPSFFTAKCLADENFTLPERFTKQGVYDIHVTLHSMRGDEGSEGHYEIYEVSYRIFENDGTFRRDIAPDDTRTLVFEIYVSGETVQINAIGYRAG